MDGGTIATIVVGVAIVGFLWTLHRDMAAIRERMAKLEGLFEGLTERRWQGVRGGPTASGED